MIPFTLRAGKRCMQHARVLGVSAVSHVPIASQWTMAWAPAATCMPELQSHSISTCSTVMMGHRRHREHVSPTQQAEQLILRAVSVDELAQAVSQLVLEDSTLLLKAMHQVLKTVHIPVPPYQAAILYPVLDRLTAAAEQHMPQLSLEDVTKAISVCRMVRFAPDALLEALARHLEVQGRRGRGLSTARPQDVAELLCCIAAMGSPAPQLAPMLGDACARHAHHLDCRALAGAMQALASMLAGSMQHGTASAHDLAAAPSLGTVTAHPQCEPWQQRLASELCAATLTQLNQAGPKELFQVASALTQLPRTAHSAALVKRLQQTAVKSLSQMSGRQLTSFARNCALHEQPNLRLARALLDEVRDRLGPLRKRTLEWGVTVSTSGDQQVLSQGMVNSLATSIRALGLTDSGLTTSLLKLAVQHGH